MTKEKDQTASLPQSLDETFLANPLMATVKLARFKFPAKLISATDDVLDLGCGRGQGAYFYAKATQGQVHGIDLYTDFGLLSEYAGQPNLSFAKEDLLAPGPELRERRFDVVTCVDVIEHFPREDGLRIIDTYSALLRPGGMMIFGTPSRHSEQWRSEASKSVHEYEYTPEELRGLFDERFARTLYFSMNDEIVHTGFDKMAWFFYVIGFKLG